MYTMKDIQGVQRGKCNKCECEEYRSPPPDKTGKCVRLRCEYCDHTPVEHVNSKVEHVKMVMGGCKKCGEDNCEKYESEDPNNYTDCQYCGCEAKHHVGAEKCDSASGLAEPETGVKVRMDPSGKPVQTAQFGYCKFPGCTFPKRIENGRLFDFCSRTCSIKYGKISSHIISGGSDEGVASLQSQLTTISVPQTAKKSGTTTSIPPPGKLCAICNSNSANAGRAWCERCYSMAKSQKH